MSLTSFLQDHTEIIKEYYKNATTTYRTASISGKPEDYAKSEQASLAYNEIYTDADAFAQLQQLASTETNRTPLLKREYEIVYRAYVGSQGDKKLTEEIISLGTQIEQKFSTYRAIYKDTTYTDNQIEEIFKESTDSQELQGIREAHKAIGAYVSEDVLQLVRLRNTHAQSLGFKNYHAMSLFLGEQEEAELDQFFDELADKNKTIFAEHKNLLDQHLAERYGCTVAELKPWHYQDRFFQEVPQSRGQVDISQYYHKQNIEELTQVFFSSIGLDISDILAKSDLYEQPDKYQHAYCIDCDKEDDVRVLCNVKSNRKWMETMLHEFGHALYDKYIDKSLPYLVRDPAHTFTTEAVAIFFQELAANADWMQQMLGLSSEEKQKIQTSSTYLLGLAKLIFAQRSQVLRRFEKALYADPEQDLNKLWRDLVSTYQLITPPAGRNSPDRASKIHIATAPCYYHNYLLGYVLAQQRREQMRIIAPQSPSLVNQTQVGKRFQQTIFAPGSSINWRELVIQSTGQNLNPDIFVQSIKEKLSS